MKNDKTILMLIVGIIFSVVAVFIIISDNKNIQYKVNTTGTISDIKSYTTDVKSYDEDGNIKYTTKTEHDVYVEYEVDGNVYTSKINSYSITYKVGKEIAIYYYSNNPSQAYSQSSSALKYIFLIIGVGLCIAGVVLKIKNMKTEL